MPDCIFCKIIAGEIPAARVYQDDKFLAFLDINPVTPGHTMIIPKQHFKTMTENPDELVAEIFIKAKELMPKLKKAMAADYVVVSVVGVDVPHLHVHLIPRRLNDGLANWWPTKKYGEGEMEQIAKKIATEL